LGVGVAVCIVVTCVLVYSAVRLFFFLPAVVVAENRIGLGRAWSLGGGNFWRIVFVWLLIVVPVGFIAGVTLEMTILPVVVMEAMKLPHKPEAKEVLVFLRSLEPLLPVILTILILWGIAVRGLMMGAIGSAYNAVTAKPPAEAAAPAEAVAPAEEATSA
jgi:membrane-anchored glycerophosphoryl diester phosphodiesterase (GDPDase)